MQQYADTYLLQSHSAVNKYLHTVASGWILINIVFVASFFMPVTWNVNNISV